VISTYVMKMGSNKELKEQFVLITENLHTKTNQSRAP
jgi:hypothetical protein